MSSILDLYNKEIEENPFLTDDVKQNLLGNSNTIRESLLDPNISVEERDSLLEQRNDLYRNTSSYKDLMKSETQPKVQNEEEIQKAVDSSILKQASEYSQRDAIGFAAKLGATDTYRGIKQLTGVGGFLGVDSVTKEEEKQQVLNQLMKNPDWGGQVRAAYMGGLFVDPAGWLIPFAKARSIGKMAYYGALSGGATSAVSYVDKDMESLVSDGKLTRTEQTMLGIAGGGLIAPVLGGVRNAYKYSRGQDLIPLVEKQIPEAKIKNSYIKVVGDPTRDKVLNRSIGTGKADVKAAPTSGVDPVKNKVVPTIEPDGTKKLKKPGYKPSPLVRNTMALKDLTRKYLYGENSDINRWVNAGNNVGAYSGAVGGASIGWTTAEEDANVLEKLGNVALYTALGIATGQAVPKFIKTASNEHTGDPDSFFDFLGRNFISNYNVKNFEEYVKQRAKFGYQSGHMAGKLLKLVRDDVLKLDVEDRVQIFRMLSGQAKPQEKFKPLTEKIRKEISILSQAMVDEGLIDAETVKKNSDIYLHQMYQLYRKSAGKQTAAEKTLIKQLERTKKEVKLIGDNLRPRGYTLDVSQKQYDDFFSKQTAASHLDKINERMGLTGIFEERGVKAVARPEDFKHKGWEVLGTSKTNPKKITIRWQYTKAQREAMGEIEDAALVVAETGRLLGNNIAAAGFLKDVSSKYALSPKEFRALKKNAGREAGDILDDEYQLISTKDLIETEVKQFGPMAGKYIPKAIYNDMRGVTGMIQKGGGIATLMNDKDWFRYLNKMNSYWKLSKTAYNPVVHTNNFMSNIMLLYLSNSSYGSLAEAFRTMANRKKDKVYEVMKRQGSLDINFIDQEIRDTKHYTNYFNAQAGIYQNINDPITATQKGVSGTVGTAMKLFNRGSAIRRAATFMEDLYRSEDSVYRIAVFRDRLKKSLDGKLEFQRTTGRVLSDDDKKFVKGLLNNTDDADLDLFKTIYKDPKYKNLAEVIDAASVDAKRWFIDYDIQAPAVQVLRRTALPFLAYTYRVIPLIAEAAVKYPHKMAVIAGLGYAADYAVGLATPENEAKERKLMPERHQGKLYGAPFMNPRMVKVPNFRDNQTPTYLDITRWIPGGDVFDVKHGSGILPGIPAPFQPSFGAYGSIINSYQGYDPYRGQPIPGMGAGGWSAFVGNLYREFAPNNPIVPGSYSYNKLFEALSGANPDVDLTDIGFPLNGKTYRETALRDRLPVMQAVAAVFGIKLIPANMEKMQDRARFALDKKLADLMELASISRRKLDRGAMNEKEYKALVKRVERERGKLIDEFNDVLAMPDKDKDVLKSGHFLYHSEQDIIDTNKSIEDFIIELEKENGNWKDGS